MKTIYLCGTIDNIPEVQSTLWRKYIKLAYPQFNYNDPTRRIFKGIHANTHEIVDPDKKDILESDYVLVFLTEYSAGTLMEILYAYEHKKTVVVINATTKPYLSAWIRHHSKIFDSIENAMLFICQN